MSYTPSDLSPAQTELATSLRIPFLASAHPRWYYVTGIVVSDLYGGILPADDEVRIVASFDEEYREHWYRDSWKTRMAEFAPYDIDGGAVGRYLIKYKHGGWGYRISTWQYGPTFVPMSRDEPAGLVSVLDRLHAHGGSEPNPRWEQWKADHPEVFGQPAEVPA